MVTFLPFAFIALSVVALIAAISFLWASLRAVLSDEHGVYVTQSAAMRARAELVAEKETVLKGLKDLEFERAVGKLSEEDFARLDAQLRSKAKRILKQLDDELRPHRDQAQKLLESELGRTQRSEKTS